MFDVKNIKTYYRLGLIKIKYFLQSRNCREYLIFLFFVIVSFAFWALQTLDEVYQTEFKIPLRLKNVPKEVVLTEEPPREVLVQVEDRGTVLLNYMLGRTFYPISFDFQEYQSKGSHVKISSNDLRKRVAGQLNLSTKVLSFRPDTLEFIYTHAKAKKLPVSYQGKIQAARQYYIAHVSFMPDSVMVYAPEEVLDTLECVYTSKLSLMDVTDTLRYGVSLSPLKGVKYVPAACEVSVFADMYSEKTVEVPVVGSGFPEGRILRTFPSKVKVSFQVGLKNFKSVTAQDFQIEVAYQDVQNNEGDKLLLSLKNFPEFIEHPRIIPSSVDFLIEQQN